MWLLPLLACPAPDKDTGAPVDTSDTSADTSDTSDTSADTSDTSDTAVGTFDPPPLTEAGGCGDVELFLASADDTFAVVVVADLGLAREACETGAAEASFTLPDAAVDVWMMEGEHITADRCTDFVEEEPVLERTWSVEAGSVTIEVIPADTTKEDCEGWPYGSATVTFGSLVLGSEEGDYVVLSSLSWSAMVGWLPG